MSVRYKIERIQRWKPVVGLAEAIRFEIAWTCRQSRVKVHVPGYAEPLELRYGTSDLSVFESVLWNESSPDISPADPQLIIDGGANAGLSTAFYANTFPNTNVVAVEPAQDNIAMLRKNTRGFRNVTVIEGGLWPIPGFLRISNPDDEAWSFRCEPAAASLAAIRAYTIPEIIALSGLPRCDLLKLDIEGAEQQLFENSADWLAQVDAILVEVHGEPARTAIDAACPVNSWQHRACGEKVLLTRRP